MSALPTVATGAASSITLTGATLNGLVNPNGSTTTALFQYSTSPLFTPTVATTIGSGYNQPVGVAVDAVGDVFVADIGTNSVYEVPHGGTIKTIGSGFNTPRGVAVDAAGDVFVADYGNNAVKEVLPNGTIKTIGSGFSGPYGVAVDTSGDVYVADFNNNAVKEVLPNGTTTKTISSAISAPRDVAVDAAGDVFVATYVNSAVYEVLPSGTVNTIGSGFNEPRGVAVDAAGDVFVADAGNNAIYQVLPNGTINTIGSGYAFPAGVAVDAAGDVFVADRDNVRIDKLSPPTVTATPSSLTGTTAKAVSATLTGLNSQTTYYDRVVATNAGGTVAASASSFFTLPPPTVATGAASSVTETGATLNATVNPKGSTTTALFQYSTSFLFTPTVETIVGSGFNGPQGVGVDAAGDVFVADTQHSLVKEVLPNGTIKTIGSGFVGPTAVAVDAAGDVFVADFNSNVVKEVLPSGVIKTIGSGFNGPSGVAVDGAGDVFVADSNNNAVKEVLPNGTILTIGSGFVLPRRVAVDSAGDVFVSDLGHNAIKEVLPNGTIKTIGSGFLAPIGVAVDAVGDVFVGSNGNNLVQEVLTDGTILTIGSGFNSERGVAVDAAGDVFVADFGNSRIVEVSPPTVAATPSPLSGTTAKAVSATLTGLTPGTTYYDRVVATSAGGTVADTSTGSFTTQQATPTATSVAPGTATVSYGQSATFTAKVSSSAGVPPDGSMQFLVNGVAYGSPVALSGATAQLAISEPAGSYTIAAQYTGDANYAATLPAAETTASLTVNQAATETAVTPGTATVSSGQSATFTATVSSSAGVPPGGSVQFLVNGAAYGSPVALSGATAQLAISESAGSYTITAQYGGDSNFSGSSSTASMLTVNPGGSLITLASFDGTNGAIAAGGLVMDAAGNSFGTTGQGGTSNAGTVFELAAGSGTITTLASFNGANGQDPNVGLIEDASGNLFGVTAGGGNASNDGTVFEVAAGSHAITTLALFSGTNGATPNGTLIEDGSGNLFGTTELGGASNDGTVFEVAAGSGAITTLASFNGANGFEPFGSLVEDGSGNLFGAATDGGAYGDGDVFEVAAGSHAITTLASFNGANGQWPQGGLIMDGSGNLFGTTYTGGASSDGTVFEVTAVNHAIISLASFNGANGQSPLCRLVEDGSGDLFGAAIGGGASNDGTLFEVAAGSGAITALASFNGANGQSPEGDLVEDGSGNLYGTAALGGANGVGVVFEYAPGTFIVTNTADSGVGSLRYEIGLANSAGGASTIAFGSLFNTPQTITLTSGQLELSNTIEPETITGPAAGVTVSGGGLSRVFQVDSGVTASISGLTITGGTTTGNGGGILNEGMLTIEDSTIQDNSASSYGGGVFNENGTVTITNVTISGNSSSFAAGGIGSQFGTTTLTDCTVSGNSALFGGGLMSRFNATTFTDCTISGYSAGIAGGIYSQFGTATLTDCTISGNSASFGGGIYNHDFHRDTRRDDRSGERGDQRRARRQRNICLAGEQPDRQDRRQLRLGRLRPDRHHRPAA